MHHGISINHLVWESRNCRVHDDGTVGQVWQIVVEVYPPLGEILAQHLLARIGHAHQVALVIEIIQADRIVVIGAHRHFSHFLRANVIVGLLGQEIAAHLGIGIKYTREVRVGAVVTQGEGHWTVAVETNLVARAQDGHLSQVIRCRTVELLADAVAARAVNMHLPRIAKAHLQQLIVSNLIYPVLGNHHFHPFARSELGLGRINRCVERTRVANAQDGQNGEAYNLKFYQFAHHIQSYFISFSTVSSSTLFNSDTLNPQRYTFFPEPQNQAGFLQVIN